MFSWFSPCFICCKQTVYKSMIQSTYDEYTSVGKNIMKKHPIIHSYMSIHEYNALREQEKTELHIARKQQQEIHDELIHLIKIYCKKYPHETICNYQHLKTYDEFPYRLKQHMQTFMEKL